VEIRARLQSFRQATQILIAVVGFAILIVLIVKTGKSFAHFISVEYDLEMRSKVIYRLMFFPIVIGSAVNTLLVFPVVAFLSILYPATSSYAIMSSFGAILKATDSQASRPEFEEKIMKSLVLSTPCTIALNRLLTFGVG
jgi:hypothetical protein